MLTTRVIDIQINEFLKRNMNKPSEDMVNALRYYNQTAGEVINKLIVIQESLPSVINRYFSHNESKGVILGYAVTYILENSYDTMRAIHILHSLHEELSGGDKSGYLDMMIGTILTLADEIYLDGMGPWDVFMGKTSSRHTFSGKFAAE